MTLVVLMGFVWISARTLLLLTQVNHHTPEARLGRSFVQELRNRGLITDLSDADRLSR